MFLCTQEIQLKINRLLETLESLSISPAPTESEDENVTSESGMYVQL